MSCNESSLGVAVEIEQRHPKCSDIRSSHRSTPSIRLVLWCTFRRRCLNRGFNFVLEWGCLVVMFRDDGISFRGGFG